MNTILLFGGTTEGRQLADALDHFAVQKNFKLFISVTSDYGSEVLPQLQNSTVLQGALPKAKILDFTEKHHVSLLIDATHPYATHISATLQSVAEETGLPLWRCLRDEGAADPNTSAHFVETAAEAANLAAETPGKILLTTGTKELPIFSKVARERLFVRVLPSSTSIALCEEAGLSHSHIIAMQGPFSEELNAAIIRQFLIDILITKDGGTIGGYEEKIRAAENCGIQTIVIKRPTQETGYPVQEIIDKTLHLLEGGI